MIIRNIFGNTPKKQASSGTKFCGICQESFQRDKDNAKLEYCGSCISSDKISKAAYWKSTLALQKANSLSPDMAALAAKLSKNRELIDGVGLKRVAGKETAPNSIRDIKASQNHETNFDVVREQVAELLPSVLAEQGLLGKVDAELLVDAIVPTKISSPISDPMGGRAALRQIVAETVSFFDNTKIARQEGLVRTHGIPQTASGITSILDEGFKRISNETGYGTRSRKLHADMMPPNGYNDAVGQPIGNGPGDEPNDFAPPQDDESNESKVVHLPDDQANQIIHDKANPPLPPDAAMDPMMGGQPPMDPNNPMAGGQLPEMMNEGVGTYSGGENQVPDASDMEDMPQDGQVKRIQSASSDLVARQMKNLKTSSRSAMPSDALHFSFAGKITSAPVQIVKLASQQKAVINNYQPMNYYTAAYNDGTKKTFRCYATDKGAIYVNDDFTVHATTEKKFAEFIQSDSSFKRWAFLPPTVNPEEDVMAPDHDIEDMALPEHPLLGVGDEPLGEGSPGFNEIKETHLNSSPDNAIPGGMAADQDAIFDNGDPGVGGPTLSEGGAPGMSPEPEDELLDTAHNLMPKIEQMFPESTPEEHQDMAIEAALNLLEERLNKAG